MNFRILCATSVLLLTLAGQFMLSVVHVLPSRARFSDLPPNIGDWRIHEEMAVPDSVQKVLQADDYVMRRYQDASGHTIDFFAAYYQEQRAGESMHSPRNCLPGAGWMAVYNDTVPMPGSASPISRYLVEKNGERMLILYWYQTHGQVIAGEVKAKIYLAWDSLVSHRQDGSIVRIGVPMTSGMQSSRATAIGLSFAQAVFPKLSDHIPD